MEKILGLAKSSILFGLAGHALNYNPIVPSSVPFLEIPSKTEQGKTPKLRKKRPPKTASKKGNTSFKDEINREDTEVDAHNFHLNSKSWKFNTTSSSESEQSDSEGQSVQHLKENQAKVRASALKMLTAAFKVTLGS